MTFYEFKDSIVEYLNKEKEYCTLDIESNSQLSNTEKEEKGLLIQSAKITERNGNEYKLSVLVNNSKLRPGDKITLKNNRTSKRQKVTVIENDFEHIFIETSHNLSDVDEYDIIVEESVLLDPFIALAENIYEGMPGASLLKQLAGIEVPKLCGFGSISQSHISPFSNKLNEKQQAACSAVLKRPSVYCIQGPPGTGKTDVLATIANIFSNNDKEVLIISNTHQAVNNALNKISKICPESHVVKIGEELKAQELDSNIIKSKTYKEYLGTRNKTSKKKTSPTNIVGMTFYSAILNLGLRNSGFKPSLILVDEAGQMPLAQASLIGVFGCGSIIFIGDDKQMPPIFHEKLSDNPLSVSIFSYLCSKYPEIKSRLSVSYRMNDEITQCVSRNFYETDGEKLVASDFSKDRKLVLDTDSKDERIKNILASEKSIHVVNIGTDCQCEDMNQAECEFISVLVKEAFDGCVKQNDLAIITPYRRQVKAIRSNLIASNISELPLVDTVERLQGQDVDLIIISFCTSSPMYFEANQNFILNKNRLNVMISRAKKKVVIITSDIIKPHIDKLQFSR